MQTIVFYGYKGGSGRTLTLANVAVHLTQLGLNVAAVDLDLESPGLHYKLLPILSDAIHGEAEAVLPPGVVGYLERFLADGKAPDSVLDFGIEATSAGVSGSSPGRLWMLPAGPAPTSAYWQAMDSIQWNEVSVGEPAPLVTMLVELKAQIQAELAPDYLLIDARTGVTAHNGVALRTLADHVVAFAMPNREHLAGVVHVIRRLGEAGGPTATIVLNRMPTDDFRRNQQRDRALVILNGLGDPLVFPDDPALRNGEFLHVGDWGRAAKQKSGSDLLTIRYLELIGRIAPESADHLGTALVSQVNAVKASIERSPLAEVRHELERMDRMFPSLVTADAVAWCSRLMQDLSGAAQALSRLTDEELRESTQLVATLEASLGGLLPRGLVLRVVEGAIVDAEFASRLRARIGITAS